MNLRSSPKARKKDPVGRSPQPGLLFVLSAPSGAGKSTMCRALRDRFPDLQYSISYTTRPPRRGEKNGVDYHFISQDAFKKKIMQDHWAEWAEVHGQYYGTSADFIDTERSAGRDILMDIDVQGALQILNRYPDSISIFIMPPSLDVLRQRLEARGTDSAEVIAVRMKNAKMEITQKDFYRHVIINDQLTDAVAELIGIIESYRR